MFRTIAIATLCLACLASTGCVTYMKDRFNDALDVGGVEIGVGLQMGAHARATKFAQAGFGYSTGEVLSWDGRTFSFYEENREEVGLGIFYYNYADREILASNSTYYPEDWFLENLETVYDPDRIFDRKYYEVGGKLSLLFIGVDAYLDILQIADFAMGFLGFDICRDDTRNRDRSKQIEPPFSGWPELRPEETEEDEADE